MAARSAWPRSAGLAEEWLAAWLEAPVWRFVLPPGLLGGEGILGLWLAQCRQGRPLLSADDCGGGPQRLGAAHRRDDSVLAAAEEAGRDALEVDLEPAELRQRVQAALVPGEAPTPAVEVAPGYASWWTEGGPRVAARFETGATLPVGARFAALMDDGWGAS